MGHRLHRLRGDHPGASVLLLRLQKMHIQEEKQKEGQRQGQKCHQHDGRQGRRQNRGNDFELLLLKMYLLKIITIPTFQFSPVLFA